MKTVMMLDVLPIKDDGITSCFDVQLQAVGKWKKTDYELMYLDNWKFVFREEGFVGKGIWERGLLAPRLYFDDMLNTKKLLEKYHGVKVSNIKQLDVCCLREILDDNLLIKKSPVLMAFDTYYIPWLEKFYKKIHSTHMIMVIGKNDRGYFFNDTRPFLLEPIHGEILDWEVIEKGFANRVTVFDDVKTNYSFNDIKEELISIDFGMFAAMKQVAYYLNENGIVFEDLVDFDGGNGILVRAFRNIIRSRIHYQECLKYVHKKYGFEKLEEVINEFHIIICEWDKIKNMLYKSYLTGKYNQHSSFLSKKIYVCSDMEEKVANKLLRII